MLEENFISSMIKADGRWGAFFERPVAGTLAAVTILVWIFPLLMLLWRRLRGRPAPPAAA
jgi:putative tricarboxylic transport membrane protein